MKSKFALAAFLFFTMVSSGFAQSIINDSVQRSLNRIIEMGPGNNRTEILKCYLYASRSSNRTVRSKVKVCYAEDFAASFAMSMALSRMGLENDPTQLLGGHGRFAEHILRGEEPVKSENLNQYDVTVWNETLLRSVERNALLLSDAVGKIVEIAERK